MPQPLVPLTRFHLRAGARVAMRALVPVVVTAVAAASVLGPDFVDSFGRALFPAERRVLPAALVATFLALCCHEGARRLALPRGAWLLHLPVSGRDHRRAALLGVAFSVLPIALLLGALTLVASPTRAAASARLTAIAVAVAAAALAALPLRRRAWSMLGGLLSATLALLGSPLMIGCALLVLVVAEGTGGELRASERRHGPRRRPQGRSRPARTRKRSSGRRFATLAFTARVAGRALGFPRLLDLWLWGAIALGMGALFLANNTIEERLAHGVGRLAVTVALVASLTRAAEHLARRRPQWAVSRTFPWSARQRVLADGALLAALVAPLLVAGGVLFPAAVLTSLLVLPALVARAVRHARTGTIGTLLLEGLLLAGLTTLLPILAPLATLGSPWLFSLAAQVERDRRVVAWHELRHEPDFETSGGRSA